MGRPRQNEKSFAVKLTELIADLALERREQLNGGDAAGTNALITLKDVSNAIVGTVVEKASPQQVSQALARLLERRQLFRTGHGIYSVLPKQDESQEVMAPAAFDSATFRDLLVCQLNDEACRHHKCALRVYLNGTSIGKDEGFLLALRGFCERSSKSGSKAQFILLSAACVLDIFARTKYRGIPIPFVKGEKQFVEAVKGNVQAGVSEALNLLVALRTLQKEFPGTLEIALHSDGAVDPFFVSTGGSTEMLAASRKRSATGRKYPAAFVIRGATELDLATEQFREMWALAADLEKARNIISNYDSGSSDEVELTLMEIFVHGLDLSDRELDVRRKLLLLAARAVVAERISEDWKRVPRMPNPKEFETNDVSESSRSRPDIRRSPPNGF